MQDNTLDNNLAWNKLSKFVQWKLFKAYMHANNIQNGDYFKRMKSLVSEKKTVGVVTYDAINKTITHVDFKHENFVRERSKKKKQKQIFFKVFFLSLQRENSMG